MMNDVIKLITKTQVTDSSTGDISYTTSETEIFCETKSIGMSEFYQANATGFKPEIKFVIADYLDYNDEKSLIYEDKEYDIIRTYRGVNNTLEITCQRKVNKG